MDNICITMTTAVLTFCGVLKNYKILVHVMNFLLHVSNPCCVKIGKSGWLIYFCVGHL